MLILNLEDNSFLSRCFLIAPGTQFYTPSFFLFQILLDDLIATRSLHIRLCLSCYSFFHYPWRMNWLSLSIFLNFVLIFSCHQQKSFPAGETGYPIDSLFEAFHEFKLRINPVEATKGGYHAYNSQFANYISDGYCKDLVSNYTRFLVDIEEAKKSDLSDKDQLSLAVMEWDCQIKLEGLKNKMVTIPSPVYDLPHFQLMPISQMSSMHLYMSQLASGVSVQPFNTVEDYRNWYQRLEAYVPWMDTVIGNLRKGQSMGIIWPKVIIERTIDQVAAFLTEDIYEHLFYAPIKLMPDTFDVEQQKDLAERYSKMIEDKLLPAFRRLHTFLVNHYLPSGTDYAGIGSLPNGPETYQYLIKYHTSTSMTPDEIFNLGMSEVRRIEKEMEVVKSEVGFTGSLRSFFDFVRSNDDLMPYENPEEVLANFERIRKKVAPHLLTLFDLKPKGDFIVQRTEAFREASASAEYVPGSRDASRPGTFYVPIPDVSSYNIFTDEALFLHEAVPGHHYQLSLQQENNDLPAFLHAEGMGVFVEGWALYCESLGKELGLYDDPFQYFGMLSMEMHRAIRLVVDAGIHAKGWTRDQAIQFSLDHEAESEASIVSSIERYMATPGQALSYKIGQLKIQALRREAEQALGDRFNIKEFHNEVLNSGSLPLVLLEEKIENWIAAVL